MPIVYKGQPTIARVAGFKLPERSLFNADRPLDVLNINRYSLCVIATLPLLFKSIATSSSSFISLRQPLGNSMRAISKEQYFSQHHNE